MLGVFDRMNARDHPRNPNVVINCNAIMVAAANLSCTEVSYTHILISCLRLSLHYWDKPAQPTLFRLIYPAGATGILCFQHYRRRCRLDPSAPN